MRIERYDGPIFWFSGFWSEVHVPRCANPSLFPLLGDWACAQARDVRTEVTTWGTIMLDWISEKIMAIVTFVPALIVDQNSPTFDLVRAMFGIILLVLVVYIIAMIPSRSVIAGFFRKMSGLFTNKK
jgi:hypothetical protein